MNDSINEESSRLEISLTGNSEQISLQGEAQVLELREKQQAADAIQAVLSEIERNCEAVRLQLKLTDGQICGLICEIEQSQSRMESLELESQAILMENMRLRFTIKEEEEHTRSVLDGYQLYRNKMECHKSAVFLVESQSPAYKEVMKKREEVKKLREEREELRVNLQDPHGSAVLKTRREVDELKEQVASMRKMVREKRAFLLREQEGQSQLRKEIKSQNRRYEAIVKRLHYQLNKAQSSHRQLSADICQMEKEVEDLKSRLEVPWTP
ncbi:coiled-coil domain-containing protein 122 [Chanos chanos]|uniref:Coiled-coil domain-containing protein 122 n=1 Tax=Chanos chanos TaxID=29144 RepID=A0A6J2W2Z4_CHACN|nr:coiled-coil domain-containing protein 122 [Chanos chanos]